MKKIIFKVTALLIVFLMASCNADEVVNKIDDENQPLNTKMFTVEAVIPGDDTSVKNSQTRVGLEKETNAVKLTWKPGDVIELCFVQGGKAPKKSEPITLTATDIYEDGKKVRFGFDLPQDFDTGEGATFSLYGVHGGGGLDETDPTLALLPENNSRMSLREVEDNNDVMLYFSAEDISVTDPTVSVNFNHLGSIYNITLESKGHVPDLSEGIKLVPVESVSGWAHTSGSFNLVSKEITGTPASEVTFNVPSGTTVPVNGYIAIYKWLPILPADGDWPELALKLKSATSWNRKGARTAAAGKNYILHAQWDGKLLGFGFLANPGFEAAIIGGSDANAAGWTVTKNILAPCTPLVWVFRDNKGHDGSKSKFHIGVDKAAYNNVSYCDYSISQYAKNLPDGLYNLEVWAYILAGWEEFDPSPRLFARGYGGPEREIMIDNAGPPDNPASFKKYEINNIEVKNGTCEIGVQAVANGRARLFIDDFNFVKVNY